MNRPETAQNPAISARQARYVGARLAGLGREEAAKKARVATRTAWRWEALSAVREALREGQDRILEDAHVRALEGIGEGLAVLRSIMADGKAPAASRVGAVRVLLETALKMHEERDLRERVEALERALKASPGGLSPASPRDALGA